MSILPFSCKMVIYRAYYSIGTNGKITICSNGTKPTPLKCAKQPSTNSKYKSNSTNPTYNTNGIKEICRIIHGEVVPASHPLTISPWLRCI